MAHKVTLLAFCKLLSQKAHYGLCSSTLLCKIYFSKFTCFMLGHASSVSE